MVYDRRKYDGLTVEEKLDMALELIESIIDAFPEGPAKHREVHEVWMQAKKAETDFWLQLKLDIAKKGTWGLLIIILGLFWVGVTTKGAVWFR